MAQLTGQQINNSYQGLLKTESNGALGAGLTNLTDGVGTLTGLSLNTGANEFMYTRPNVEFSMKNTNFTRASYPMGVSGTNSFLNFKDTNGDYVGWLSLDRFGSMYYTNTHGDQGESHVFKSQTGAGAGTPAIIRMDTYNSVNNSNNWYLGYQQSVDALSYDSGTGLLTLGRQDAADLTVTISGGGGGSAGLVAGTGTDSMKNADALVTTPAQSTQNNTIALGSNARAISANQISIGINSNYNATVTTHWSAISMGERSQSGGYGTIQLGPYSRSYGNLGLCFGDNSAAAQSSASIGAYARSLAGQYNVVISNNTTVPSGQNNVVIGAPNTNMPTGQNDNVVIGRPSTGVGAGTSNTVGIGLVHRVFAGSYDAVAIGRGAEVGSATSGGSSAVSVGREAKAQYDGSCALGSYSEAQANQATAIGYQAIAANSGWTATPKLEITNYATLNFADDATAAANGVPLGGIYHNAGALRIRIV